MEVMEKINLEYYKNQDNNTYFPMNGLEENIIEMLKNPENDIKIREEKPEIYYYLLSPQNENLLKWIDISPESEVLEVHSGLGATTKTLCQKAKEVTTINFSKTNAEILASRLKDYNNLEIIVGNIKDIDYKKKYDYIVLTDVIEFSRAFFHEVDFINFFKNMLKDNGTIILTTSNRYGIQYFSGSINHISAKAFDVPNNFPDVPFLRSFSKRDLTAIFNIAGFENIDFYYPIPNHYMNSEIISDRYISTMSGRKVVTKYRNYVINQNNVINEVGMMKDLIEEGMFSFFANSFIVIASNDKKQLPYYTQFKNNIITVIDDNCCKKIAINEEGQKILDDMYEFYQSETKRIEENNIQNIKYAEPRKDGNTIIMKKANGEPLNRIWLKDFNNPDRLLALGMEYKSLIYKLYPHLEYKNVVIEDVTLEDSPCAEKVNIDLNLSNIFYDGEIYTITDYDKTAEIMPINYMIASAMFVFAIDSGFRFNDVEFLKLLGLSEKEIGLYKYIFAGVNGHKVQAKENGENQENQENQN